MVRIFAAKLNIAESVEDLKDVLFDLIDDINSNFDEAASTATGRGTTISQSALSFVNGELAVPPVLTTGVLFQLSAAQAATIPGFGGGYGGRVVVIHNTSAYTYTIAHESGTALPTERVTTRTGASLTIAANNGLVLIYDDTTSRWIPVCNQV